MALRLLLPMGLLLGAVVAEQDSSVRFSNMNDRLIRIRDTLVPPSMYKEAMFHAMSYYAPMDAPLESELCRDHSTRYLEAFLNDTAWAMKMFDASSKIGDGLSRGNFIGLGSYDGCLDVDADGLFRGKHCLVEVSGLFDTLFENANITEYTLFAGFNLDIAFSMCIPSSCSAQDLGTHMDIALRDINATGRVNERSCSVKEPKQFRVSDWAAIYVLAVLACAVILSTSYDYYVCYQPSKNTRILTAFSIQANTKKLLRINNSPDVLSVIYFLRFFAIVWIVAGHRFDVGLAAPSLDLLVTEKYLTVWWMAPILSVNIAVEIFFLLSGLLVAYNFLKSMKAGHEFSLFKYYVHRYIRLTPSLALVVLLEATLMYQVSEGPIWKRLVGACMDKCVTNWWSTLLYVSNYLHPYTTCMLQSWYLCVDMQLYILSPLLLIPLHRNAGKGVKIIGVLLVATIAASYCNALYYGLQAGPNVTTNKRTELNHGSEYTRTHVRAASWLMGLILGYLIFEFRHTGKTFVMQKTTALLGWIASTVLWVGVVFSVNIFHKGHEYSPIVDPLYFALGRPILALGFGWVIFACVFGYGGPINTVMSWKVFQPLGTLSYGIYLSHLALQVIDVGRTRVPYQYDFYILISKSLSDVVLATICAYFLYIAVEGPCLEIDKWIFSKLPVVKEKGNTTAIQMEHNTQSTNDEKSRL